MTIVTIEIDKEQDLSALKDYLSKSGLNFEIEEAGAVVYSDEFKAILDERYKGYLEGNDELIDHDDVQQEMRQLLAAKNKDV